MSRFCLRSSALFTNTDAPVFQNHGQVRVPLPFVGSLGTIRTTSLLALLGGPDDALLSVLLAPLDGRHHPAPERSSQS
jgi:hypothetical protein